MIKKEKPKMHIASCSFGKDSIATILLALENNEPLDRVVFSEVMFDHSRNISGELPEHIEWIYNTAIPKLESMGCKIDIVKSKWDYVSKFNHIRKKGKYVGKAIGFPIAKRCEINSSCKIAPIKKYYADFEKQFDIVQYVGIAIDEPNRLERLKGTNKVSLLAKYGYSEEMAMAKCKEYNLISPCYSMNHRGGCFFCMQKPVAYFVKLRQNHPHLWTELKKLNEHPNTINGRFKYNLSLDEVELQMNKLELKQKSQLKLFEDNGNT